MAMPLQIRSAAELDAILNPPDPKLEARREILLLVKRMAEAVEEHMRLNPVGRPRGDRLRIKIHAPWLPLIDQVCHWSDTRDPKCNGVPLVPCDGLEQEIFEIEEV